MKLVSVLAVLALIGLASASVIVAPTDPKVQYDGRYTVNAEGNTLMSWESSAFTIKVNGGNVSARVRSIGNWGGVIDSMMPNCTDRILLQVFIDGLAPRRVTVPRKSDTFSTIALTETPLSVGEHLIKVYKDTEPFHGTLEFAGFVLDDGRSAVVPPTPAALLIEYYGDSITVGCKLSFATVVCFDLHVIP